MEIAVKLLTELIRIFLSTGYTNTVVQFPLRQTDNNHAGGLYKKPLVGGVLKSAVYFSVLLDTCVLTYHF